jgi:hypothetical protein
MGFAKYFEDNVNITAERKYERAVIVSSSQRKIYYDCYYCNKSFESIENRNSHIKSSHNVVGPLLFINGKIAQNEYYVDEMNSAKIVLCGFYDIAISVNNQIIKGDNTEIDLIPYLNNENDTYSIEIGQKTFNIYKYNSTNISSSNVDDIINRWEELINADEQFSFTQEGYAKSLNKAEIRYLNGFYDYYTACKNTISSTDKNARYQTAFAILSSFNILTPKARVLLKIIAFRWNWIETLENLSKATAGEFDIVVDFFYERKSTETKNVGLKQKEQKLFVEYEIEDCFNAIVAYQNGNWDVVNKFLANWTDEKIVEVGDINKKDRILLLKARQMKIFEKYPAAKKYYDDIKTPFIKKEAENYGKI